MSEAIHLDGFSLFNKQEIACLFQERGCDREFELVQGPVALLNARFSSLLVIPAK